MNASIKALSVGLPGREKSRTTPFWSERQIAECLAGATGGTTVIIVAHRLSAIADQILGLDHGRVTERGKHEGFLPAAGFMPRCSMPGRKVCLTEV